MSINSKEEEAGKAQVGDVRRRRALCI